MIQSRSVWIGRGDTSLAGLNASFREWTLTPEQLIDVQPERIGADWTVLHVRYDTSVKPKLVSSTIHQGAWFQPTYRPTQITLVFNTAISKSSIENGTFKLVYGTSEFSVLAASVVVDKELVTIGLTYPAPSYTGPVTLLGSAFESESGGDSGDAVNLQFSIVDENHLPSFTPANHGQTSNVFRYGTLRAGRIMIPFGTKPETMLKGFLAAHSVQESQIVKSIYRGNPQAGYSDLFVVWYPLVGIRLVGASPGAWLPSEAAVDRILVNFDQPVALTADQVAVTGPGGTVTVTPVAMDARKTQWKLTGTFTSPGQYHVILSSLKNMDGETVPFRHAFGWQVMPTEIDTGVSDHGALTGLGDDDHTQYILVAGTRPFTGHQSMGGFRLTTLGAPSVGGDAANKTYVDAGDATEAAARIAADAAEAAARAAADALLIPLSYLDTDGTLAANSDTKIATQKATKTYVDAEAAARAAADSAESAARIAEDLTFIKKDGSRAFTGTQSMGGFKLTNVLDPVSAQDADTLTARNVAVAAAIAAHLAALDPHPQYLTQLEGDGFYDALGAASAAVAAHVALSDPHTQYQKESEKDVASGYAGLNSDTRVIKEVMLVHQGVLASRPVSGTQAGHVFFATDELFNAFTGRLQVWIP